MPLTLPFRRIDVEKMERGVLARFFQKPAAVVVMAGKPSRELTPRVKLGSQIADGTEIHPNAADAVNVDDSANILPKIGLDQSQRNRLQGFVLIVSQRIVRWFVALVAIDSAQLTSVPMPFLLAEFGPCRCARLHSRLRQLLF